MGAYFYKVPLIILCVNLQRENREKILPFVELMYMFFSYSENVIAAEIRMDRIIDLNRGSAGRISHMMDNSWNKKGLRSDSKPFSSNW